MRKNIITLVIIVVGLPALLYTPMIRGGTWPPARIAGLCVLIIALPLFILARLELGSAFSFRPQATKLVMHGLYARIRNPIYVFGFLVIIGVFLTIDAPPYFLLILLVIVPLQVKRSRAEARVLEAKFGEAYREYRKKTWF
jgi:protein-S-isoprenylcysteine O-methyltransferase Ste14